MVQVIHEALAEKIDAFRQAFHEAPELSWEEENTKKLIQGFVPKSSDVQLIYESKAGLLYRLKKGEGKGKRYLLRADIDGLPIQEETGLPYASKQAGKMHACGHDAHMAMLLGAMHALDEQLTEGTVYFIFQASEESPPSGAKALIEEGAFASILPLDGVLGLHVVPHLMSQTIGLLPVGCATTANGFFEIHIHGKSSHSSQPHLGIDPLVPAAELILGANEIIAKALDPREFHILAMCMIQGGTVKNQLPERCTLGGSIRILSEETKRAMIGALQRYCDALAMRTGAAIELIYEDCHPSIQNDPGLYETFKAFAQKHYEGDTVDTPFWQASEDFCYYEKLAPVYYFHLGVAADEDAMQYTNHHPKFTVDRKALLRGADLWTRFILAECQK